MYKKNLKQKQVNEHKEDFKKLQNETTEIIFKKKERLMK
jgi:hypothetical protein